VSSTETPGRSVDQPGLSRFLIARYAEDEANATSFHRLLCMRTACDNDGCVWGEDEQEQMHAERVCTCGYPERLIADARAKARVVMDANISDDALRALATPYADHTDFDPIWRT
jgi:hypothetical protein